MFKINICIKCLRHVSLNAIKIAKFTQKLIHAVAVYRRTNKRWFLQYHDSVFLIELIAKIHMAHILQVMILISRAIKINHNERNCFLANFAILQFYRPLTLMSNTTYFALQTIMLFSYLTFFTSNRFIINVTLCRFRSSFFQNILMKRRM